MKEEKIDRYINRDISFYVEHKVRDKAGYIWLPVTCPYKTENTNYRWPIKRVHDIFRLISVNFGNYANYEVCYYLKPDIKRSPIRKYDYWPPDIYDLVLDKIGVNTFIKASLTLREMLERENDLKEVWPHFTYVVLANMKRIDNNYDNVRAVFGFG
jgi:hypothetical protein